MRHAVSDRNPQHQPKHPPLIRLDGVGKSFGGVDVGVGSGANAEHGGRVALRDVSLAVRRGDIVGIAGAPGSGKSTLLRTINLLAPPDRGSVTVAGQDLARLPRRDLRAARQRIGMMFAEPNLLNNLTVAENVALPLRLHGTLNAPRLARRVRDCLAQVGLEALAASYPARLTAGQRRLVAAARALAPQPEILLCDDPTAALAPDAARMLLATLCEANATLGTTILVAGSDLPALGALCRRVVVLEDGAVAETVDLYDGRNGRTVGGVPRRTAIGRELACYGVELRALLGKGMLHA
jgi:D-methionine transport system ATP-binding protein